MESSEQQTPQLSEHTRGGYSLYQKTVAALGFGAVAILGSAGMYAHERELSGSQTPCIEQACGQAALRELLQPDLLLPSPHAERTKAPNEAIKQPDITVADQLPASAPKRIVKPSPKPTNVTLAVGVFPASEARPTSFESRRGIDISWPQCAYDPVKKEYTAEFSSEVVLPKKTDFVIVGVTAGHEDDANPCLARELKIAQKIAGANVSLYVNAANPVKDPKEAETYGRRAATDDLNIIRSAARKLKTPLQPLVWIDVERGNKWQPDTASGHASNVAFMKGVIEAFNGARVSAGIYTAKDVEARPIKLNMWEPIMGVVPPKSILNVPEWIASPGADGCTEDPFIKGGHVVIGQNTLEYPKGTKKTLDFNTGCQSTLKARPAVARK